MSTPTDDTVVKLTKTLADWLAQRVVAEQKTANEIMIEALERAQRRNSAEQDSPFSMEALDAAILARADVEAVLAREGAKIIAAQERENQQHRKPTDFTIDVRRVAREGASESTDFTAPPETLSHRPIPPAVTAGNVVVNLELINGEGQGPIGVVDQLIANREELQRSVQVQREEAYRHIAEWLRPTQEIVEATERLDILCRVANKVLQDLYDKQLESAEQDAKPSSVSEGGFLGGSPIQNHIQIQRQIIRLSRLRKRPSVIQAVRDADPDDIDF